MCPPSSDKSLNRSELSLRGGQFVDPREAEAEVADVTPAGLYGYSDSSSSPSRSVSRRFSE